MSKRAPDPAYLSVTATVWRAGAGHGRWAQGTAAVEQTVGAEGPRKRACDVHASLPCAWGFLLTGGGSSDTHPVGASVGPAVPPAPPQRNMTHQPSSNCEHAVPPADAPTGNGALDAIIRFAAQHPSLTYMDLSENAITAHAGTVLGTAWHATYPQRYLPHEVPNPLVAYPYRCLPPWVRTPPCNILPRPGS